MIDRKIYIQYRSIMINFYSIKKNTGHTNFIDEVAAATRLADGAVIVVDVVEGVKKNEILFIVTFYISLYWMRK